MPGTKSKYDEMTTDIGPTTTGAAATSTTTLFQNLHLQCPYTRPNEQQCPNTRPIEHQCPHTRMSPDCETTSTTWRAT